MDSLTFLIEQVKHLEQLQRTEHESYRALLLSSLTPEGEIREEKSSLMREAAETLRRNEAARAAEIERATNEALQQIAAQSRHLTAMSALSFIQETQKMRTPLALPVKYLGVKLITKLRKRKMSGEAHIGNRTSEDEGSVQAKIRITDSKTA